MSTRPQQKRAAAELYLFSALHFIGDQYDFELKPYRGISPAWQARHAEALLRSKMGRRGDTLEFPLSGRRMYHVRAWRVRARRPVYSGDPARRRGWMLIGTSHYFWELEIVERLVVR